MFLHVSHYCCTWKAFSWGCFQESNRDLKRLTFQAAGIFMPRSLYLIKQRMVLSRGAQCTTCLMTGPGRRVAQKALECRKMNKTVSPLWVKLRNPCAHGLGQTTFGSIGQTITSPKTPRLHYCGENSPQVFRRYQSLNRTYRSKAFLA